MTVSVYVASDNPTSYPRKLQKPATASSAVRETAATYILDSGIGDDVSNAAVLDLAHKHDADYVIAKDYLHDQERTTESVRTFLDQHADHPTTATPMVPLQPPHDEHYRDLPGHDHYVLGGMALEEIDDSERARWIRQFRRVEPDAYAHALGVGGGIGFIRKLAGSGLIDSVDCATPEIAAKSGKVIDRQLRQSPITVHSGEGARERNVPLATFNSWQIQDVWTRETSRGGLDRFRAVADGGDGGEP